MNGLATASRIFDSRIPKERFHSEADRQEKIRKRAVELRLPGGECDPFDKDNLAEALSESAAAVGVPDYAKLASLLRKQDDIGAANLIRHISVQYWTEYAERKVTQDMEDAVNYPCCAGRGCARCERNEF
jgi:hypothetical protein